MEEQFIASLCRLMVCFCYQKNNVSNHEAASKPLISCYDENDDTVWYVVRYLQYSEETCRLTWGKLAQQSSNNYTIFFTYEDEIENGGLSRRNCHYLTLNK